MLYHTKSLTTQDNDGQNELQEFIDTIYNEQKFLERVDVIVLGDAFDLSNQAKEILLLIPKGSYIRSELIEQINVIIAAHGWKKKLGMLD